jgi:hypothetical protein
MHVFGTAVCRNHVDTLVHAVLEVCDGVLARGLIYVVRSDFSGCVNDSLEHVETVEWIPQFSLYFHKLVKKSLIRLINSAVILLLKREYNQ